MRSFAFHVAGRILSRSGHGITPAGETIKGEGFMKRSGNEATEKKVGKRSPFSVS